MCVKRAPDWNKKPIFFRITANCLSVVLLDIQYYNHDQSIELTIHNSHGDGKIKKRLYYMHWEHSLATKEIMIIFIFPVKYLDSSLKIDFDLKAL